MTTALIVCGALVREVLALQKKYAWDVQLMVVPAILHNTPQRLPAAIRERIQAARAAGQQPVVVYGDCGTGGMLDRLLAAEQVERVAGPHCYEMYANEQFETLMEEELGTFFLTDFLVDAFDQLVIKPLGLDRYPELRADYFGAYTRVVYLVQRLEPRRLHRAHGIAHYLGLNLEVLQTHYGALETRLVALLGNAGLGFASTNTSPAPVNAP